MLGGATRKIWARRIRNFWTDFSHHKVGFAGSMVLIFFVSVGILAPLIAPEDPIFQKKVAARYAMPAWMKIDPRLQNLPPTIQFPFNVTEARPYENINVQHPETDYWFEISYNANGNLTEEVYTFEKEFNYTYNRPPEWQLYTRWTADFSDIRYRFEIHFRLANGSERIIYGKDYDIVSKRVKVLPQMWNTRSGEDITGSGSTYLKRRLYYEKHYKRIYHHYLSQYGATNLTIKPQFMAFTYPGFQSKTAVKSSENPIYQQYLKLNATEETNATWTEYHQTWMNSSEGRLLWNVTYEYMQDNWDDYVDLTNKTSSSLYRFWQLGIIGSVPVPEEITWAEVIDIFDLTFTTIKDNRTEYLSAMKNTTLSPAYERWSTKWNNTLTWERYLQLWLEIQYQASNSFLNRYVKPLRAIEEIADRKAKSEAFNLAAISPSPTYFLRYKGIQTLVLKLFVEPQSENATLNLRFDRSSIFTVWGAVHGILGTNSFGFDVFTQLVHGTRISLIVGSLAAVLSTTLGILFGVSAGYIGGIADEIVMRIVDLLLCLPVLPLLLALSAYWKPNVYYLVLIIAIFGWQGLSRLIRSKVLSLREMPFIESARASGASSSYLITRHLIPNVFPLAMASMVLAVPGAILTEAALSFLGFGDPFAPTWGKMLHEANSEGAFSALAWWYIIPPGLAITFLCLAFVLVGHALDEIVNPRLRRRR